MFLSSPLPLTELLAAAGRGHCCDLCARPKVPRLSLLTSGAGAAGAGGRLAAVAGGALAAAWGRAGGSWGIR